jgi:hypothetical protein
MHNDADLIHVLDNASTGHASWAYGFTYDRYIYISGILAL